MAKLDSLDDFLDGVSVEGTHRCVVDKVSQITSKSSNKKYIRVVFTVMDETSDVDGEEFTDMIPDVTSTTMDQYNEMTGSEKSQVRAARTRLRDRLMSLGVPESQLKGFKDFKSIQGRELMVTVEPNGQYVNIRNVEIIL